ncbi:hypothetical protein EJ05DRAFT_502447 [Pseudovirgaria hyperparasitica]|uniref:Initiator tRNA phosphoribosyl transferase n=1 Tax=Pseudovirgaria hyperparasitica TaxID=470096 RepID=A0A6A6W0A5_9PEZI|nr:uncharacterized protein EJ05DRAFT_502447 [Pseudovirgaria hyperparasitica]KAF2755973.1 hypothetical protein EJ05DRAFT_502447 [Pseudovirgaria hyperparasitica]
MSRPLQTSDIIFPSQSTNFSEILSSLKRSTLSISNRLKSITEDATFVCSVADAVRLPLIANERCGSWYIPPERKTASAYFKSTDGHMNEWAFSLRRLNTQVLDVIGQFDGCIIVDSTRRGKRMPDALSKTVPIWCCVLNRVLFPELEESHTLFTATMSVSASEHAQIEARIPRFVRQLQELGINLSTLRASLHKPLRPVFVTREGDILQVPVFEEFHRVVLCTTSRTVLGGEMFEGSYVQGAGDDAEGWSRGLTAPLFWRHKARLLNSTDEDMPELISQLLVNGECPNEAGLVLVKPTTWLYVGAEQILDNENATFDSDAVIHCGGTVHRSSSLRLKSRYLHMQCSTGKLGSRDLRKELNKLQPFMSNLSTGRLFVCCQTGKDLSLGTALAIICLYANANGSMTSTPKSPHSMDKPFIRQRLAWVTTSMPTLNPSRATLQSVNSYLMSSMSSSPTLDSPNLAPTGASSHPTSTLLIFRSLVGTWQLERTLSSKLTTHPSGTVEGSATFNTHNESVRDIKEGEEVMYEESGSFKTNNGLEFSVRRRYLYRYDPKSDEISVLFVKEDGKTDDGLFVQLQILDGENDGITRKARSKETHVCAADLYDAAYEFHTQKPSGGEGLGGMAEFHVRYDVRGPQKDYTSATIYTRLPG